MLREEAHQLIDQLFDARETVEVSEPKKDLPKDKRAVRTKMQGDKVFLLDEVKKTRQWVTNPDVLTGMGFDMSDVQEVDDSVLMGYQMGAALYK